MFVANLDFVSQMGDHLNRPVSLQTLRDNLHKPATELLSFIKIRVFNHLHWPQIGDNLEKPAKLIKEI